MRLQLRAAAALSVGIVASAQTAPNPDQVAYTLLAGKMHELRISNEDGTNLTVLHRSKTPIRFDLGPRGTNMIALSDGGPIKVLTYERTSSGAFANILVRPVNSELTQSRNIDVSPDGTKIAFPGAGETLLVHHINENMTERWGAFPFVWDVAWYSDSSGIAVVSPDHSNTPVTYQLFKVPGRELAPQLLLEVPRIDSVDAARTDASLVLTYYDGTTMGNVVGLWKDGAFTQRRIDDSDSVAEWGTLNCSDRKLLYAAPNKARQSVWYILNRDTGLRSLYSKATGLRWTQFFPDC